MLPKGNVSKHHARLLFRDGRFIVTDLKSTNGTYVNGRKISQATIVREGDKIYIGDFVLRLETAAGRRGQRRRRRARRRRRERLARAAAAARGDARAAAAAPPPPDAADAAAVGRRRPGLALGAAPLAPVDRRRASDAQEQQSSRQPLPPRARSGQRERARACAAGAAAVPGPPRVPQAEGSSRARRAAAAIARLPPGRGPSPRPRRCRSARDAAAGGAPQRAHRARRPSGRRRRPQRPSTLSAQSTRRIVAAHRRRRPRAGQGDARRGRGARERRPRAARARRAAGARRPRTHRAAPRGRRDDRGPRRAARLRARGPRRAASLADPVVHERGGARARRGSPGAPVGRAVREPGRWSIERRLPAGRAWSPSRRRLAERVGADHPQARRVEASPRGPRPRPAAMSRAMALVPRGVRRRRGRTSSSSASGAGVIAVDRWARWPRRLRRGERVAYCRTPTRSRVAQAHVVPHRRCPITAPAAPRPFERRAAARDRPARGVFRCRRGRGRDHRRHRRAAARASRGHRGAFACATASRGSPRRWRWRAPGASIEVGARGRRRVVRRRRGGVATGDGRLRVPRVAELAGPTPRASSRATSSCSSADGTGDAGFVATGTVPRLAQRLRRARRQARRRLLQARELTPTRLDLDAAPTARCEP